MLETAFNIDNKVLFAYLKSTENRLINSNLKKLKVLEQLRQLCVSEDAYSIGLDMADFESIIENSGASYILKFYYRQVGQRFYEALEETLQNFKDKHSLEVSSAVVLFEIHPDFPLAPMSKVLDVFIDRFDIKDSVIFGTDANDSLELDEVGLVVLVGIEGKSL